MRRMLPLVIVLALSAAWPAPASADVLIDILDEYVNVGRIDPCTHSEKTLRDLKDLLPTDLANYADFGAAVDDALARRAQGACNKDSGTQPTAPPPPASSGATPPPPPPPAGTAAPGPAAGATAPPATAQAPPEPAAEPTPAPVISETDAIALRALLQDPATDAPFPVLALAILAGILALGGLLIGVIRWRAWEPAWAKRMRHAAGEAGWRASSTWAEFTDFVRFGR